MPEIVVDYIDILIIERTVGTVVKAKRHLALQAPTGWPHGSIEYKHQKISAVMADFGLPFTRGCEPAKNYPRTLFEAADSHLCAVGLHDRLASTASEGLDVPAELVYQPPPILSDKPESQMASPCSIVPT